MPQQSRRTRSSIGSVATRLVSLAGTPCPNPSYGLRVYGLSFRGLSSNAAGAGALRPPVFELMDVIELELGILSLPGLEVEYPELLKPFDKGGRVGEYDGSEGRYGELSGS
jgi:hypothetical protein